MQGFNQGKSGYTADSISIVLTGATNYDPEILDNPIRKAVNFAVINANERNYRTMVTL